MAKTEETSFSIDECMMSAFEKISTPLNGILSINNISEIKDVVTTIRQTRIGPTIKIASTSEDQFLTTQFRASFYDKGTKYLEQLYIDVRSYSTYRVMFRLLNENLFKLKNKENEILSINGIKDTLQEQLFAFDKMMSEYEKRVEEKAKDYVYLNSIAESRMKELDLVMRESVRDECKLTFEKYISDFLQAKQFLKNEVKDFISNKIESIEKKDLKKVQTLNNRIIAIWFLAECFRYPPMLFYSLITLHNCLNGYITSKDIEKRIYEIENNEESDNPIVAASGKGSQRILWLSLQKISDENSKISGKEAKQIEKFNEGKMKVLEVLYNNLSFGFLCSYQ